jgi:hypothetical protein
MARIEAMLPSTTCMNRVDRADQGDDVRRRAVSCYPCGINIGSHHMVPGESENSGSRAFRSPQYLGAQILHREDTPGDVCEQ